MSRWSKLHAELDDLRVRLDDADAAHYLRGDLDARRHRNVATKLAQEIIQVEQALAETDPHIDTTPLDDPTHVAHRWQQSTPDARRALLRLAWTKILVAKASTPGGKFDPGRISYMKS